MQFDFVSLFRSRGVHHVQDGKNTKRGEVNVKCPFCGPADPSEHLGCDPATGRWACWRDRSHSGGHPAYLLQALLGVTKEQAEAIVAEHGQSPPGEGDLEAALAADVAPRRVLPRQPVPMPSHFLEIKDRGVTRPWFDYLCDPPPHGRGFQAADVAALCRRYRLRADVVGRRLVLPFLMRDEGGGGLNGTHCFGWQARAITDARLRYVSHPEGPETKELVYNHAACQGGDTLVVVEGPIGTINVDWHGHADGVNAVGLLGANFVERQVQYVFQLSKRYDRLLVLLDPGAETAALQFASRATSWGLPVHVGGLPAYCDGPDDLRPDDVAACVQAALR